MIVGYYDYCVLHWPWMDIIGRYNNNVLHDVERIMTRL